MAVDLSKFGKSVFTALSATVLTPCRLTAQTAAIGPVLQRDIVDWQAALACYGPDAITSRKPIEDELNIKFVRLINAAEKKYYFESLTIPKISTQEYLESIPKISCRINDKELYDWVSPIKGNPTLAAAEISSVMEAGK